jgi:hypothetical protein
MGLVNSSRGMPMATARGKQRPHTVAAPLPPRRIPAVTLDRRADVRASLAALTAGRETGPDLVGFLDAAASLARPIVEGLGSAVEARLDNACGYWELRLSSPRGGSEILLFRAGRPRRVARPTERR